MKHINAVLWGILAGTVLALLYSIPVKAHTIEPRCVSTEEAMEGLYTFYSDHPAVQGLTEGTDGEKMVVVETWINGKTTEWITIAHHMDGVTCAMGHGLSVTLRTGKNIPKHGKKDQEL